MAIFTRLSNGEWGICLDARDGEVVPGTRVLVTKRNGRTNAVTARAFSHYNTYGEAVWTFSDERRATTPVRGVPVPTTVEAERDAARRENDRAGSGALALVLEADRVEREAARPAPTPAPVTPPVTEAAEFAALGFPRVAARAAAPAPAPVARAPRIETRDIVAGAAAEGSGALTGWRGDGALPRTEILAALRDAGLPEDWAPAAKSCEGHAGKVCSDRNLSGYVVRRVKARDLPRWARTLKARWELFRATGDRATLLTVDLSTYGDLTGIPDEARKDEAFALFNGIHADYLALRDGEVYEAGDVTAWLSRTLRKHTGAVAFGVGYYLPGTGRPVASALVAALSARWGAGWINPLLPIATSDELRRGVARSLVDEVAGITRALEVAREAAKKAGKEDIGPARAATLVKELETVHERVGGYRVLCGDEVIRPVVADIAALLATLSKLTNDASVRFALLDIPDEVAAPAEPEAPSIAERAAEAAAARRRTPETRVIDGETYEVLRGPDAPTPAPAPVKRPPTEPPAERNSTDDRFGLLELD